MMTFYRHQSGTGNDRRYWVTLVEDRLTIARTETYTAAATADNAVAIVQAGKVTYGTFKATDGYRFRIKGLNGEIVFQATRTYDTQAKVDAQVARIKRDAPGARYLEAQAA